MNFLWVLCLFVFALSLAQSLHLKRNTKIDSTKSITDAVKLYRNDKQIQTQIQKSVQSQPLFLKQFTCQNDPNYKYIVITKPQKDSFTPYKMKKQVIVTCNIHARELITSEVCVDFISNISNTLSYPNNQFQETSDQFNFQSIDSLLSTTRLTIFYRGNDMRDSVLSGKDYCIRKDKNDIDINRNFPTNFNIENYPSSNEQYPGSKPLSEPFSQCLDSYLHSINQTTKINVYVDIHTGEFTLFDSYESENNQTWPILQKIKRNYCPQCRIATLGSQKDGEVANGQIFVDVKKRYQADHSILMEIYGGYNDNLDQQQNCIAIFNPLTKRQLDYYRQTWNNALLSFIKDSLKQSK